MRGGAEVDGPDLARGDDEATGPLDAGAAAPVMSRPRRSRARRGVLMAVGGVMTPNSDGV